MQARPTDLVELDNRDIQTRGGAVQGGGVASRSSADDHDIELLDLINHGVSLQ
jgi:hypothetical protein